MSGDSEDTMPGEEVEEIIVEDPLDPLEEMQEKILELERELQYAAAEIVNIRQRSIRDRNETIRYGGMSLSSRLIPIIDNLSRALESTNEGEVSESLVDGIKLTLDGMMTALEQEGVVKIEINDGLFDPSCMESIASIACPEGKLPGSIIEVVEDGYKLHDRVLRATKVVVAEG